MAALGAASISGVPPFGLPKIKSLVGGIFSPTFSASPLWSMRANSVTPLDLQNGLQLVDRLVHGVMARNFDDPFFFLHGPSLRGQENGNREHEGRAANVSSRRLQHHITRQQSSLMGNLNGGQAKRLER